MEPRQHLPPPGEGGTPIPDVADGKPAMRIGALVLAFGCVLMVVADSLGVLGGKIVGGVVMLGGFLTYLVGRVRYRRQAR